MKDQHHGNAQQSPVETPSAEDVVELPPEGVSVEILSLGPPLYSSETNEFAGYATSRIRDTTQQRGGLPVFLDGVEIGAAFALTKTEHEEYEALCYQAQLALLPAEIDALRSPDRRLWAGIKGSMGLNGLYPTAINLRRSRSGH